MRMADTLLNQVQKQIAETEVDAVALAKALDKIDLANRQATHIVENLRLVNRAVGTSKGEVDDLIAALRDVNIPDSTVFKNATNAELEKRSLKELEDQAKDTSRAMERVGMRSTLGTFLPRGGPTAFAGGGPGAAMVPFIRNPEQLLLQNRVFTTTGEFARTVERGSQATRPVFADPNQYTGRVVGPLLREVRNSGFFGEQGRRELMKFFSDTKTQTGGLLAAMGWGGGGGIPFPRILAGFGWGGRRRGFGRLFPGMASFGSLLGLAGFGAERAVSSTLGIAGSMGGGLLGGGLLGLGALGTSAVGMGTDLAGIGQAAGDTKTISTDLGNLTTAIQRYGKASSQARSAQGQLNSDLAGFSPVARQAVLAAAQTSQAFKDMFDRVTGQAEKTGAQIINQAMKVGEKFLPTIGAFAAQNMNIIKKDIQPFFDWLQNPGRQGGLGIFTDLEKTFQKDLPTAVHAMSQGFELFVKTVDVASHYTGNFLKQIDEFLTKANSQSGFAVWSKEIGNLIGLFRTWLSLFTTIGKTIFDLMKPAVGFGAAFAKSLTGIISQMRTWINLTGTQNVLHSLFAAHTQQVQELFKLLSALLPVLLDTASAFLQIEAAVVKFLTEALRPLVDTIKWLESNPLIDKILGWAGAMLLARRAATAVYTALKLIASGSIINGLKGIIAGFLGIKTAAVASAEATAAAEATVGTAATAATTEVVSLRVALMSLGAPEVLAGIAVLGGALYGLLDLFNGGATQKNVKDAQGHQTGTIIKADGKTYFAPTGERGFKYQITPAQAAQMEAAGAGTSAGASAAFGAKQNANRGGGGAGGPHQWLAPGLPYSIDRQVKAAQAGHGSLATANARAYQFYQRLLSQPGLTGAQRTLLYQAQSQYAPGLDTGGGPLQVPSPGSGSSGSTLANLTSPGLAAALSNAQAAVSSNASRTNLRHLLDTEQRVLAALKEQGKTGKELVQIARERAALSKEIANTEKMIHQAALSGRIDKILGIGSPRAAGSQSIQFRERTILLDLLERQVGGKKHTLATAAAALGLTPSQLENEPMAKIMKQIRDSGFTFSKATLNALHRINEVLNITRKDHLKLTPDEKTKIADMLKQIKDTLTANVSNVGTSYVPATPESIVNAIPGLSLAQKLALEQSIAQAQGHKGHRPSGGAAAGIALPGLVLHVHGDLVLPNVHDKNELARELRQALLKTQRRNATQTRGPNAGRSVGLN